MAEETKRTKKEKQPSRQRKSRSNSRSLRLTGIPKPQDFDVLYGRGGLANHHPGNKRYRRLIQDEKTNYLQCSDRSSKTNFAMDLVHQWRKKHQGRFLRKDDNTGLWNDVGDKKARAKTSQLLREDAPNLRQKLLQDENAAKPKASTGAGRKKTPSPTSELESTDRPCTRASTRKMAKKQLSRDSSREVLPNSLDTATVPPSIPKPITSSGAQSEKTDQTQRAPSDDGVAMLPIFRNLSDLYSIVTAPDAGDPLISFDVGEASSSNFSQVQQNSLEASEFSLTKELPALPVVSSLPPIPNPPATPSLFAENTVDPFLTVPNNPNQEPPFILNPIEQQLATFNNSMSDVPFSEEIDLSNIQKSHSNKQSIWTPQQGEKENPSLIENMKDVQQKQQYS